MPYHQRDRLHSSVSRYHSSRLQLTASRSTCYHFLEGKGKGGDRARPTATAAAATDHGCYQPRAVSRLGVLSTGGLPYREFDAVGMVAHVSSEPCPPRGVGGEVSSNSILDLVYLADVTGVLEVKVHGGLKVSDEVNSGVRDNEVIKHYFTRDMSVMGLVMFIFYNQTAK